MAQDLSDRHPGDGEVERDEQGEDGGQPGRDGQKIGELINKDKQ